MKRWWWAPVLAPVALGALWWREIGWEISFWRAPAEPRVEHTMLPPCPGCNLVLVSMDTLRADFADRAPNLNRIAARGVTFTNAYTNAFYTAPSHMTLFTSVYPNRHKIHGRDIHLPRGPRSAAEAAPLEARFTTLAEVARGQGYHTHWFAPLGLKHLDPELGFGRGFGRFSPPLFQRPGRPGQFDHAAWRAALKGRRPFFHFVHSYVTHLPYFLPGDDNEFPMLFGKGDLIRNYFTLSERAARLPAPCSDTARLQDCLGAGALADAFLHDLGQFQLWTMEKIFSPGKKLRQKAALTRAYGLAVGELDRQLSELWRELEAAGRLGDTLVLLVSDHGEELFEHGHGSHSSFYGHTARIPMVLFHPRLIEPRRTDGLVSLIDVVPTLAGILGWPVPPEAQGRDLGQPFEPRPVFGFSLGSDFVTDGRWKLIRGASGTEEIYFLPTDPEERHDLSAYRWPRIQAAAARLREERRLWELEQAL